MEYRRFGQQLVVRIDRGEELMTELRTLCGRERIRLAAVSGLGAADYVDMGLYDVEKQEYQGITLEQPLEITSLIGSVTEEDGKPYLHLHINVADASGRAYGGHLRECRIGGTCELFLTEAAGHVSRRADWFSGTGLKLYDFS